MDTAADLTPFRMFHTCLIVPSLDQAMEELLPVHPEGWAEVQDFWKRAESLRTTLEIALVEPKPRPTPDFDELPRFEDEVRSTFAQNYIIIALLSAQKL